MVIRSPLAYPCAAAVVAVAIEAILVRLVTACAVSSKLAVKYWLLVSGAAFGLTATIEPISASFSLLLQALLEYALTCQIKLESTLGVVPVISRRPNSPGAKWSAVERALHVIVVEEIVTSSFVAEIGAAAEVAPLEDTE